MAESQQPEQNNPETPEGGQDATPEPLKNAQEGPPLHDQGSGGADVGSGVRSLNGGPAKGLPVDPAERAKYKRTEAQWAVLDRRAAERAKLKAERSAAQKRYAERVLPWGETCRKAEQRLSKLELRARWQQKQIDLYREHDGAIDIFEAGYLAHLDFAPDELEEIMTEEGELKSEVERFLKECREGLKMDLPMGAGVDAELEWISGNLHRRVPDVKKAPSYRAINCLIDLRTDQKARTDFWKTLWTKRLTPGDSKNAKARKPALKRDEVEATEEDSASIEEVMRRLGMTGVEEGGDE